MIDAEEAGEHRGRDERVDLSPRAEAQKVQVRHVFHRAGMPLAPPVWAGCGSAGSSPKWIDREWIDRGWVDRQRAEVVGAGVVTQVGVAMGAAPQVRARLEHRVGPATMGLQP